MRNGRIGLRKLGIYALTIILGTPLCPVHAKHSFKNEKLLVDTAVQNSKKKLVIIW